MASSAFTVALPLGSSTPWSRGSPRSRGGSGRGAEAATPRSTARVDVRGRSDARRRHVVVAANPDETLPSVLFASAAKKFVDDVAGFAKLFEEGPAPTYERPPTLPVAGNLLDIIGPVHTTLLSWALEYGGEGLHELKMLKS